MISINLEVKAWGKCDYLNLQQHSNWEHARWTFFHSQPKPISVRRFVVALDFQEMNVKGLQQCSRDPLNQVKNISNFTDDRKEIRVKLEGFRQ
jgi:hypothetical protein